MSSSTPLLAVALLSTLAVACTDAQSYTPISEDNLDELCRQSTVSLNERSSIAVELDEAGKASYDGSLDVSLFTETEMRVDTDELIFSIPGGTIATVSVGEGSWDLFTSMVFAVDVRTPGSLLWEEVALSSNAYDIFWFTDLEFNGSTDILAATTLALCSTVEKDANGIAVPFDIGSDYEMRIRAFPFDGFGDLVGTYDYSIDVEVF